MKLTYHPTNTLAARWHAITDNGGYGGSGIDPASAMANLIEQVEQEVLLRTQPPERHDEFTMDKVHTAIHRAMPVETTGAFVDDIIKELQNAGILFRERTSAL